MQVQSDLFPVEESFNVKDEMKTTGEHRSRMKIEREKRSRCVWRRKQVIQMS